VVMLAVFEDFGAGIDCQGIARCCHISIGSQIAGFVPVFKVCGNTMGRGFEGIYSYNYFRMNYIKSIFD
jgi:hypothetical protein